MSDAKDYVTTDEWYLRDDMENAPLGKRLFVLNEGGKIIEEILTNKNKHQYSEWSALPMRASKRPKPNFNSHICFNLEFGDGFTNAMQVIDEAVGFICNQGLAEDEDIFEALQTMLQAFTEQELND